MASHLCRPARYERDLNGSSRPPLRLIVTRDASVESSMVLCISNIIWPTGNANENGRPANSHPELEVTDGWYRLRAQIDAPLARATRKGIIKIGRKIAIAGSKVSLISSLASTFVLSALQLSSLRKEGSEILEAYDSTVLILSGNSSHMASWHAKLGFQKEPFIATLNSLTPDGGNVALMAIEIVKVWILSSYKNKLTEWSRRILSLIWSLSRKMVESGQRARTTLAKRAS